MTIHYEPRRQYAPYGTGAAKPEHQTQQEMVHSFLGLDRVASKWSVCLNRHRGRPVAYSAGHCAKNNRLSRVKLGAADRTCRKNFKAWGGVAYLSLFFGSSCFLHCLSPLYSLLRGFYLRIVYLELQRLGQAAKCMDFYRYHRYQRVFLWIAISVCRHLFLFHHRAPLTSPFSSLCPRPKAVIRLWGFFMPMLWANPASEAV